MYSIQAPGKEARVAQAYGEHPETAAPRMRWARAVVQAHGVLRPAGEVSGAPERFVAPVCCAA
jgi:hypothetical protein